MTLLSWRVTGEGKHTPCDVLAGRVRPDLSKGGREKSRRLIEAFTFGKRGRWRQCAVEGPGGSSPFFPGGDDVKEKR